MRSQLRNVYLNIAGSLKKAAKTTHILNLHYISRDRFHPDHKDEFESFLKYLNSIGKLISLEKALENINSEKKTYDKAEFALTFDDGYEECYDVIAPALENYGTTGAFFVNSNYIGSGADYQKAFNQRVRIHTKKPMNWEQVIDLHNRGHSIGSHTADHFNLSRISIDEAERQILSDKQFIESKLKFSCDFFAWPYGTLSDYPLEVHNLVKDHFTHIFSSANHKSFKTDSLILNRRHVEPSWNRQHINYFVSDDKRLNTYVGKYAF